MADMTDPPAHRVYGVLIVALFAVSLAAIFVRLAEAPGVVIAAYRMVLASLILLPASVRSLRHTPLSRKTFLLAVLAGVFLGAHFATWITSLSYTSVTASVTLVNTHPLWVALFSWFFFGRSPTLAVLFGILLAVAGGSIIGFGDLSEGSDPLLGDALALCGALFIAGYFLLGRTVQRLGLHLNAYVGIAYGVAALFLLPLPALFDISYVEYGMSTYLWIGMLALVPQLIGHTGINYTIKYLDPTFVATTTLFEPIGASILAFALFRELPLGLTVVGALVLLSGIVLVARSNQVERDSHEVT